MQSSGNSRETIATIVGATLIVASISWAVWGRGHDGRDSDSDDSSAPVSLDAPVTLDPDVRTGTLANGLRYYIRENDYPEQRAELRLVVDAGSVLEDDDQRGLAHAVEHMAFRGTRRFPGRAIETYLQSVGMRLGEDVNATTSYDETTYRLTIPTNRKAVVDSAIMMLADWAHAVTFDSSAARQEGSVVFEEWRTYRGAEERVDAARDTLLFRGSRYASRPIIGDTATLRRFDVAAMRRFYRDWYRPDRIAVVAVGDFDARAVERTLRQQFEPIPRPVGGRAVPDRGTSRGPDERVVVVADPELAATRASLWFPRAPLPQRTAGDYRQALVERLARSILSDRLDHEAERAGSPLLSAGVSVRRRIRPLETHAVGATLVDGQTAEGIATLGAAIERLRRFGPKPSELAAVKESMIRESRSSLASAPESADMADAIVDHHLRGDLAMGVITENRWTNDLVPGIGQRDITSFLEQLSPEHARAIVIVTPARRVVTPIDRRRVLAVLDSATSGVADERTDTMAVAIMSRLPAPGTVTSRTSLAKIGVHEWRLSNGMRVLLKPTDFEDDEVEIRLTAPGGASLATREDYASAYMSDNVLEATGAGDFNGSQIARLLDARSVSLSPVVNDERIGLTGSGRRGDLELMLQLAHLYLTAPREDQVTFRRYRERLAAYTRNRGADPDAAFGDTVASTLRPGDPRALRNTSSFVAAVDMDKALGFWRERAKNASGFTAVIVGDFEIWQVSPLIERYLGSLPAGHPEQPADMGHTRPDVAIARSFRRGIEPSALTRIVIGDTMSVTLEADAALDAARQLLDMALHERLREELAGTYGVTVSVETFRGPRPSFAITMEFTAAPDRIDSLAAAALVEVERLRSRGPPPDEASRVRKAAIEHSDEQSAGNNYWANELAWHSLSGWSLESIAQHADDATKISAAMLTSACARYLDGRRFVRVTRVPEVRGDSTIARVPR